MIFLFSPSNLTEKSPKNGKKKFKKKYTPPPYCTNVQTKPTHLLLQKQFDGFVFRTIHQYTTVLKIEKFTLTNNPYLFSEAFTFTKVLPKMREREFQ